MVSGLIITCALLEFCLVFVELIFVFFDCDSSDNDRVDSFTLFVLEVNNLLFIVKDILKIYNK